MADTTTRRKRDFIIFSAEGTPLGRAAIHSPLLYKTPVRSEGIAKPTVRKSRRCIVGAS
jgi:hypothetical protein